MPLFDALSSLMSTSSFTSSTVNADAAASGAVAINAAGKKSVSPRRSQPKRRSSPRRHSRNHNTVVVEHSPVRRRTPTPTKNLCSPMRHCSSPPPPRAVDCCARGKSPIVTSGLPGQVKVAVPHDCKGVWGDPKEESCSKGMKKFTLNFKGQEDNDYRLLHDQDIVLDGKFNTVHTCGRSGRKPVTALSTVRATTPGGHEIQIESNGFTSVDGHELPIRASVSVHDNHGNPIDIYHSPKGVLIATNNGRNHLSVETNGSYIDVLPEGHFKTDATSMFGWMFAHKTAQNIPVEKFNLKNLHAERISNVIAKN